MKFHQRKLFLLGIITMMVMILVLIQHQSTRAQPMANLLALEWSPDGTKIAVAETGNGILLLEGTSLASNRFKDLGVDAYALSWSPDGKLLAACLANGEILALDVTTGKTIATFIGILSGYPVSAWSPDGKKFAVVGTKEESAPLQIWAHDSTIFTSNFTSYSSAFLTLAWRPDSELLVAGRFSGIVVFEQSGSIYKDYSLNINVPITALTWSPDGKRLFLGDLYGTGYYFDFGKNQVERSFKAHEGMIIDAAWSPDGTRIISAGADLRLRLWDSQQGDNLEELSAAQYPIAVSWSRFGGRLAYGLSDRLATPLLSLPKLDQKSVLPAAKFSIIIPAPSNSLLNTIIQNCVDFVPVKQALLQQIEQLELDHLISLIQQNISTQISPACADDVLAVAQAMQTVR
ncbi:MAG: WD40 repeat domain-containing protein [Anaerolineae bacterium]